MPSPRFWRGEEQKHGHCPKELQFLAQGRSLRVPPRPGKGTQALIRQGVTVPVGAPDGSAGASPALEHPRDHPPRGARAAPGHRCSTSTHPELLLGINKLYATP